MSARVCNPMAMAEIVKLRSPATIRKPTNSISVARVKRNLFGPVDTQGSKIFIERELAAQSEALSKKWGFDFGTGQPLQSHGQYRWERVPPTSAPACFNGMMTITRVAHVMPPSSTVSENLLDQRAERENGNAYLHLVSPASVSGSDSESECSFETVRTYPLVLRSETSAITARAAVNTSTNTATSSNSSFPAAVPRAKRQQRITDFLKERKRRSTSSPKSTEAKKARQNQEGLVSSSSMSSSATAAMPPV